MLGHVSLGHGLCDNEKQEGGDRFKQSGKKVRSEEITVEIRHKNYRRD